jgi:hypothetical protein
MSNPIEVRIVLLDRVERDGFSNFMLNLEQYRAEKAEKQHPARQPDTPEDIETDGAVGQAIEAEYVAQPRQPEGGEAVVGTITPKVPTDEQMFEALREFMRKHKDQAKAMAVLAKHGVEKIRDEMTDEVRVALYKDLTAK